jgi:hypothetical protein
MAKITKLSKALRSQGLVALMPQIEAALPAMDKDTLRAFAKEAEHTARQLIAMGDLVNGEAVFKLANSALVLLSAMLEKEKCSLEQEFLDLSTKIMEHNDTVVLH